VLRWRIICKASSAFGESFSDGEENIIPILPNRILVTESLPINLKSNETKQFSFDRLIKNPSSPTLKQHTLTVEYTTNPAWYAILSLPYLMEYPYECAEQTWNRYYANAIATSVINSSPKIKQVFEKWKSDTSVIKSILQKNG
jgi:hypothetical protein